MAGSGGFPTYETWESKPDFPLPSIGQEKTPFGEEFTGALDRYAAHQKAKPRLGDKQYKPSLAHRLAAAAAKFGSSYVNMGGRTRVDPQDTQALTSKLLHPGYGPAMQEWEEEGEGLYGDVGIAREKAKAGETAERLSLERQRTRGATASSEATAAWRRTQQELARRPRRQALVNRGKLGMFDPNTGKTIEGTVPPPEPPKPVAPTKWTPASAIISDKTTDPQKERARRLWEEQNQPRPPRALQPGPGHFLTTKNNKDRELARAEELALEDVKDVTDGLIPTDPGWAEWWGRKFDNEEHGKAHEAKKDRIEAIYKLLRIEKQRIQDDFESDVGTLTGEPPPHFQYPEMDMGAIPPNPFR
jgi:hypothetical protein